MESKFLQEMFLLDRLLSSYACIMQDDMVV